MIEELKKLLDICEQYSEELGDKLEDNEDLKDLKESMDCYLERDYQKLVRAIELFDKTMIFNADADDLYSKFYQQMLSSMADFATYFDDFHKVIFRLNRRRNYLRGLITLAEYQASDILDIEYEDE